MLDINQKEGNKWKKTTIKKLKVRGIYGKLRIRKSTKNIMKEIDRDLDS